VLQKKGGITGHEFESLVIAELYKQMKNSGVEGTFYHLRTSDGAEIDALLELQSGYIAFEIKMAEKVNKGDAKHIKNLASILDKPLLHGFVLSCDPDAHRITENITALHAAYFLG
jgi:predicted AAA+ superfamily ATPase